MRGGFVDPGALRHELSLQALKPVGDGAGGYAEDWVEVATVFARIEPAGVRTRFGAGQRLADATHAITLRHRDGVERGMRLVKRTRHFEILAVADPDETGRFLVCTTVERT